ncbi:acetyltransferase [Marinoscillum sp. MHG1-6]|uniref:acetyltransferase n=1 Tax=Marinoscillum sp. MHG1-6 TaxID=2959627 RepID=UPI00215733C3|nr:acetyltransferase [Marinoscillum sp. MHG1-6]
MDKPVIIFGAKGIGTAALEIFKSNNIVVYGFLEDDKEWHGKEIDDVTVLGKTDDHGFLKLIGQKCEAFVATDENPIRKKWVKMLIDSRKVMPVNAVHQSAIISGFASIGHGNFINAGAVVGANSKIGQQCLIHSRATIEHDVEIGDFVQVGAGAVIGANVTIEEGAFIGAGATVVNGVKIGKNARVGAGSVVVADIADKVTVFGNPATAIEK